MELHNLHRWDLAPQDAIALQNDLANRLIDDQALDVLAIRTVAGVDVSVKDGTSQAAVVVASFPDLQILETVTAQLPTQYPYIPGLLTFREGPVLEQAFQQLQHTPDVFIFDGMGQIHPRRMGIAAHMGLWLDRPTIGCGKTHFIGDYAEPGTQKGDSSPLHYKGQQLGMVLRTRNNVKPIYISVGHRAELQSAVQLTLACITRYRLPEPIRMAHNAAGQIGNAS